MSGNGFLQTENYSNRCSTAKLTSCYGKNFLFEKCFFKLQKTASIDKVKVPLALKTTSTLPKLCHGSMYEIACCVKSV